MSEPKLISPLLDNFIMGDPISDHHGVRCCPAIAKDSDDKYIVKIISIPSSQTKLDALLLTGAYPNIEACEAYFKDLVRDLVNEIEVLQKLSAQEGFVACDDYQVVPMEDGTGFDIYLLTKYRRSFERHCKKNAITHLEALNLALDMCSALAACRRSGYLYADLKPGNIYITENNEYRIGDMGFINLSSLKYASLPEKYLGPYTAPEIKDAFSSLNTSIDIYALGAILYQVYNNGVLPTVLDGVLAPPTYADEEIGQIIVKALDTDPAQRWEDPAQMGQAIVSYMQRNGASSDPIVPPIVEVPAQDAQPHDEAEETIQDILGDVILDEVEPESTSVESETDVSEAAPVADSVVFENIVSEEAPTVAEEASDETHAEVSDVEAEPNAEDDTDEESPIYSEDDFGNLRFIEDSRSVGFADVSLDDHFDDISSDDSASAQAEEENADVTSQAAEDSKTETDPVSIPIFESDSVQDEDLDEILTSYNDSDLVDTEETESPEDEDDVVVYDEESEPKPKKKWVKYVVIAVIALLLLVGGFLFYRFYYLQPIDDLKISGSKDQLTVYVTSDIEESLLSVVCENVLYGKSVEVPVVNGTAQFSGLLADAEYVVTVKISGFHALTGKTTESYFSPDESSIVEFSALTGSSNGSAEFTFVLDGPTSDNWTITYSAPGEEEKSVSFTGRSVSVNDLTVGVEYTATLQPETDLYLTGPSTITFVASNVIQAQNLKIISLADGKLVASWDLPEDENVDGWKVRCYNDSDYNKTITTNNSIVTFDGLDHTKSYTVEVTAIGQSLYQQATVGENAITVSNVQANTSVSGTIKLTWESTSVPEAGWIVTYTVEGMDEPQTITASENAVSIISALPGLDYTFNIQSGDDTPVVHAPVSCTTPSAANFRREYLGYTVTRNNLSFGMCRTPSKANWDYKDVPGSAYTRVFKVGESASFIIFLNRVYGTSSEVINTTFAFYNDEGKLVGVASSSRTWTEMWFKNYCEMEIPTMPTEVGNYTVQIYFNGEYVTTQSFSIK